MKLENLELWENLTISNDFIFSKVMRDKEICKETLEILLNKKIGEINYIDDQKTININYDSKSIRLNIYVEDEKRIYNIEMQIVNKKDLPKRSRYYQSMINLNVTEQPNENNFVKKLENKIKRIKENKGWRVEYMKSLLREQEIDRDSFEKGKGATKGEKLCTQ